MNVRGTNNRLVIDTNVPAVANLMHPPATLDCVEACIEALSAARRGIVLMDDTGLIFSEYHHYLSHRGQPGVGDAFFKWLWDNQANPLHCQKVAIEYVGGDLEFAEFPNDPDLQRFDRSDRKFVAVAIASGVNPPILNASDTDRYNFRLPLTRYVTLQFLCPELMR